MQYPTSCSLFLSSRGEKVKSNGQVLVSIVRWWETHPSPSRDRCETLIHKVVGPLKGTCSSSMGLQPDLLHFNFQSPPFMLLSNGIRTQQQTARPATQISTMAQVSSPSSGSISTFCAVTLVPSTAPIPNPNMPNKPQRPDSTWEMRT